MRVRDGFLISILLGNLTGGFGYSIESSSLTLSLKDVETRISPLSTIFVDKNATVIVDGLQWTGADEGEPAIVFHTFVNGKEVSSGKIKLPEDRKSLPAQIEAGEIFASSVGSTFIEVQLRVGQSSSDAFIEVTAYKKWMSIIPLIIALILTLVTSKLGFSLLMGTLVGACMVENSFAAGVEATLTTFLVDAISDANHIYIYLFVFCLSGFMALLHKGGGVQAMTALLTRVTKSPKIGQLAIFFAGAYMFFDEYASVLFVGEVFGSVIKFLPISDEKFAFIVDSTSTSISSINPLSTWFGYQSTLIQSEIDRIIEYEGTDDLYIPLDGRSVFLNSIKYQYYSIFMLCLIPLIVVSGRDVGPMLIAERKRLMSPESAVTKFAENFPPEDDTPIRSWNMWFPILVLNYFIWQFFVQYNNSYSDEMPNEVLPGLVFSTVFTTVITQLFFIVEQKLDGKVKFFWGYFDWVLPRIEKSLSKMSQTVSHQSSQDHEEMQLGMACSAIEDKATKSTLEGGEAAKSFEPKKDDTFEDEMFIMQKFGSYENIEMVPAVSDQKKVPPVGKKESSVAEPKPVESMVSKVVESEADEEGFEEEIQEEAADGQEEDPGTSLLPFSEGASAFFRGGVTAMPVLIVLTIIWSMTEAFLAVGLDRLIADILYSDTMKPEMFPAAAFACSMFVTLFMGTSWGSIACLFPVVLVPTYEAAGGDPEIFYAVIGAITSGAVFGANTSPIANTTMLTCHATGCGLKDHLITQTPYTVLICVLSLCTGFVPVPLGFYSVLAGYFLGVLAILLFLRYVCRDILHPEGKFDSFTQVYLLMFDNSDLEDLQGQIASKWDEWARDKPEFFKKRRRKPELETDESDESDESRESDDDSDESGEDESDTNDASQQESTIGNLQSQEEEGTVGNPEWFQNPNQSEPFDDVTLDENKKDLIFPPAMGGKKRTGQSKPSFDDTHCDQTTYTGFTGKDYEGVDSGTDGGSETVGSGTLGSGSEAGTADYSSGEDETYYSKETMSYGGFGIWRRDSPTIVTEADSEAGFEMRNTAERAAARDAVSRSESNGGKGKGNKKLTTKRCDQFMF